MTVATYSAPGVRVLGHGCSGQVSVRDASGRRLQRTQAYISKAAATSMAHTKQIRLAMVPSIFRHDGIEGELPATPARGQRRWRSQQKETINETAAPVRSRSVPPT